MKILRFLRGIFPCRLTGSMKCFNKSPRKLSHLISLELSKKFHLKILDEIFSESFFNCYFCVNFIDVVQRKISMQSNWLTFMNTFPACFIWTLIESFHKVCLNVPRKFSMKLKLIRSDEHKWICIRKHFDDCRRIKKIQFEFSSVEVRKLFISTRLKRHLLLSYDVGTRILPTRSFSLMFS